MRMWEGGMKNVREWGCRGGQAVQRGREEGWLGKRGAGDKMCVQGKMGAEVWERKGAKKSMGEGGKENLNTAEVKKNKFIQYMQNFY